MSRPARSVVRRCVDDDSPTAKRQRALVLALTIPNPVPRSKLTLLSPEVAAAYANKTSKTLSRDLNTLLRMQLVRSYPEGFRANTGLMAAFMPMRKARAADSTRSGPS